MSTKAKKGVRRVKCWGLGIALKGRNYLDVNEIYMRKSNARTRIQSRLHQYTIIPVEVSYPALSKPHKLK